MNMADKLQRIRVKNYRCLRDVSVDAKPVNVLFGPNGVGKTSFLDALWFVRDCAIHGADQAASDRHHGIGVIWDGAAPEDRIEITLETSTAIYTVTFGYSSGRIEPFVGELLQSKTRAIALVDRKIGSDQAVLYHEQLQQTMPVKLREPEKPAFSNFLLLCEPKEEARELDEVLRAVHLYSSRSANFFQLRKLGSETSQHTFLWDRWQNLWSALRNLHDRRALDTRYDTIIAFMRKAFPGSFKELVFEQLGSDRVYASFVEEGRRQPIQASGVSDGHLQLLSLLTALFGDQQHRFSLQLFDEPETSLHPHAIVVSSEAVKLAVSQWNRQVFLATHSPVLMSQFAPEETLVFKAVKATGTEATRLSDLPEIKDLLDRYALGSLYMAEEIAQQSAPQ
jgi:predicted ATPase